MTELQSQQKRDRAKSTARQVSSAVVAAAAAVPVARLSQPVAGRGPATAAAAAEFGAAERGTQALVAAWGE
jgi:hypothetical protein